MAQLKTLENGQQNEPKSDKWKRIIKLGAGINELDTQENDPKDQLKQNLNL